MKSIHDECNVEYSWTKEDKGAYNVSWVPLNITAEQEQKDIHSPWVYKTMMDLDGKRREQYLKTT